ncbi:sugar ABC transporter permease, partial [Oryzobacter sp. R7]
MTTTELDQVEARTATDKRRINRKDAWTSRGLLLPAVIFLVLLTQVPFLVTIGFSLMRWNLLYPDDRGFTGLDNFKTALTSGNLWPSIVATVL